MVNTLTTSLIDTNILVYASNEDSLYHTGYKDLVTKAINGSILCAIAFQNLVEFYAVMTDKTKS
jgi:predicted nucleic acid-binding protein